MTHEISDDLINVENAFAGIVIVAQTFNPSIFNETWLVNNHIINSDSLVGMRIFSPEVAQFQAAEYQVLILPPKMQITFGLFNPNLDINVPKSFSSKIVELLPHTPYQTLGLNFDYFVTCPEKNELNTYNKALLGDGNYKLISEFSSPDAKFGRYFSKDYGESRLKLDIKPIQAGAEKKDLIQFSFNFNYEISHIGTELRSKKLVELIGNWDSIQNYAISLLKIGLK